MLKRLERRPLSGGGNFRSGSTPYDTLNVALKFSDGIATAEDVRVEGPAARLTLTGTASVPAREYDLKGVASLISAPNAPADFDLPFVVQGPWDDPLIFPDPESLIRRSPASAPLLDAVKDRKTRDAVRSVLERFTGGGAEARAAGCRAPAVAWGMRRRIEGAIKRSLDERSDIRGLLFFHSLRRHAGYRLAQLSRGYDHIARARSNRGIRAIAR